MRDSSSTALRAVVAVMTVPFRASVAVSLLLASCASSLSEADRSCPCAAGWTCCAATNVCARDARSCPSVPPVDSTPPAAPSLRASSPASPTNLAQVDVIGIAEAGARVELFTNAQCAGPTAGAGVVDAAEEFHIAVTLVPDATTQVWAHAIDGAGNVSACTATPLAVVQDSVPPARPVLSAVTPAGPSNSVIRPELSGTAEAGSTVVLYEGAGCASELPYAGAVDVAGAFHIEARVERNTARVFAARAFDPAGNGSACSVQALRFEHDDIPPPAPDITGTMPASPSPVLTPALGASAEPHSVVKLHAGANCDGSAKDQRTAGDDGAVSFQLAVAPNATSTYSLAAVDPAGNVSACSTPLGYVHDDVPPAPVASAYFSPASPAQTLRPVINGFVAAQEPAETVQLRNWWDGSVLAVANVGANGSFVAPITVGSNTSTEVRAAAVDAAGNMSAWVLLGWFENDTIAPRAPSVASTSVPSPAARETTFQVVGTGEFGTHIDLWSDPLCSISLPAGSQGWEYQGGSGSYHAYASISAGGSTEVYATSTDLAGNRSSCSSDHVNFTNRTSGPVWSPVLLSPRYFRAVGATMAQDGTVFGAAGTYDYRTSGSLLVSSAPPNGAWREYETLLTTPVGQSPDPVALAAEAPDAVLVVWALNVASASTLHSRLRAADGTWSADEVFSSHSLPASHVMSMSMIADRAGGAWAAWTTRDGRDNAWLDELWVAHHTPGSGWSAPLRMASPGAVYSFHVRAGRSGHAVLFWEESNLGVSFTRSKIAFYDPVAGWAPPEPLDVAMFLDAAIDDQGRTLMATKTAAIYPLLQTRFHDPVTGWEEVVVHESRPDAVGDVSLEMNAPGQAVLIWGPSSSAPAPDYKTLLVRRYSPPHGWGPIESAGRFVGWGSMSLQADGSLWLLATGIAPHLQLQHAVYSEPTWLLRYEPATGWLRPQLVIDDAGGCWPGSLWCSPADAVLLRNDAGTALLQWTTSGSAYAGMRWFR